MNLTDALFSLVKKPPSLTEALFYKKIMGDGGGGIRSMWADENSPYPLTLYDAVEYKIKKFIQYGACEQTGGSPLFNSPVDIKCNNGTLQMVDDELPLAYKRITGIKFDGNFHYDTGEVLYGDDSVTLTLANTSTSGQNVFGSYNGTSSGTKNYSLFVYGGGSSSNSYYRYGEQLLRPRFGSNERTITLSGNGTDGFATDVSATPDTFTTVASAYIGMLPNSSSAAYTGSIMGDIVVSNSQGVRCKWIPCERQSDGAVGYYDLANESFLEKIGSGSPVKGSYDTSHMTKLAVIGTPQVITIKCYDDEYTASAQSLFAVGASTSECYDEQDLVTGVVKRRVGIKIFDGTETFVADYNNVFHSDDAVTDQLHVVGGEITYSPCLCTNFKPRVSDVSKNEIAVFRLADGTPRVKFHTGDVEMSVAELKQWFADQYAAGTPVILLYGKEETTTETVPKQELFTFQGRNYIYTSAEVTANGIDVDVTYRRLAG